MTKETLNGVCVKKLIRGIKKVNKEIAKENQRNIDTEQQIYKIARTSYDLHNSPIDIDVKREERQKLIKRIVKL